MSYCSICGQTHDGTACPMHYDQDMPIYNEAMDVIAELKKKLAEKEAEIAAAREVLKEIDEYLSINPLNSVGSGSILHTKARIALESKDYPIIHINGRKYTERVPGVLEHRRDLEDTNDYEI